MDPLRFAVDVAREAGRALRARAGGPLDVREKALRGDLVTAADRESEALIVARIRASFPNAAILGEEGGVHAGTGDERWIVDPLDGTTNYAHGYPMYCVSIAYERAGEVVAAVVYAPVFDETFAAERGAGTTLDGASARVSATPRMGDALVCTGFLPAKYERNGENFARASRVARGVRRDGSAALDLAYVACGRFDGFWEFDLKAWDVAAGALLVREAGGRVSSSSGGTFALDGGSIAASNGAIHAELVATLVAPDEDARAALD